MVTLFIAKRRFLASVLATVACAFLTAAGGCRPADSGSTSESHPAPSSISTPSDSYATLMSNTIDARREHSCLGEMVVIPDNPQAITVSTDQSTGHTRPLPFLLSSGVRYLPQNLFVPSPDPETPKVEICFDKVRQIWTASSPQAPPKELTNLLICGIQPPSATRPYENVEIISPSAPNCQLVETLHQ